MPFIQKCVCDVVRACVVALCVLPLHVVVAETAAKFHLETDMKAIIETVTTTAERQSASSASSASASTLSTSKNTTTTTAEVVECGNTDGMMENCFKELPSHLVEFLQTTNFAADKEAIESKCTVFHRVMSCFDEYAARCLTNSSRLVIEGKVGNAKRFFHKFCNNPTFQRDYLQHKDCFGYIEKDWDRCTDSFKEIMLEEFQAHSKNNLTNKFIQLCCARKAYEECIYKSARYKCYPESAQYALDTARLLSEEKYFRNCRQYEEAFCPSELLNSARAAAARAHAALGVATLRTYGGQWLLLVAGWMVLWLCLLQSPSSGGASASSSGECSSHSRSQTRAN